VLTGHVGPKAFAVLQAANIIVYAGASGTVREALDCLKCGKLHAAKTADVEGHWN
jgi:predicted Fe-Mo cluster-binding NifX family protein